MSRLFGQVALFTSLLISLCLPQVIEDYFHNFCGSLETMKDFEIMSSIETRPAGLTNTAASTNFIVHYISTGADSCSSAYARIVSDALEDAYAELCILEVLGTLSV